MKNVMQIKAIMKILQTKKYLCSARNALIYTRA